MDFFTKKMIAFAVMSLLPVIMLFAGASLLNISSLFNMALLVVAGLFLSILTGVLLITHPLLTIAEGKGLGALGIDSSGIFKFYVAKIKLPFINIKKSDGQTLTTIFDRKLVVPVQLRTEMEIDKTGDEIKITLPKNEYSKYNFGYASWNFLLINEKTNTLISKEFISNAEDKLIADHEIFYISRKIDDLSNNVRDFGRYIIEQLRKTRQGLFGDNGWILIILLVGAVVLIAILFGPKLMEMSGGVVNTTTQNVPVKPLQ